MTRHRSHIYLSNNGAKEMPTRSRTEIQKIAKFESFMERAPATVRDVCI